MLYARALPADAKKPSAQTFYRITAHRLDWINYSAGLSVFLVLGD